MDKSIPEGVKQQLQELLRPSNVAKSSVRLRRKKEIRRKTLLKEFDPYPPHKPNNN